MDLGMHIEDWLKMKVLKKGKNVCSMFAPSESRFGFTSFNRNHLEKAKACFVMKCDQHQRRAMSNKEWRSDLQYVVTNLGHEKYPNTHESVQNAGIHEI